MNAEVILAAAAVVGLLVTVASVFGSFRIARNTGTVAAYRESAQAWESKAKAQEVEIRDLQTQLAAAQAQIEALTQRVAMLQDMVTSKGLIEALGHSVDNYYNSISQKMDAILATAGDTNQKIAQRQAGDLRG